MTIRTDDEIGPFTIEKALSGNKGGMSKIYLAYDTFRPAYKAALKVQRTHDNHGAAYQDLLRFEASLLKKLRHPGIVRIFPLRIDSKVTYAARAYRYAEKPWYYAMEFIQGDGLGKHINDISKYPLPWAIELFYQIVVIVGYLHKAGYAHCDLKPQNIMFRTPPNHKDMPTPILVDFGSAAHIKKGIVQLAASPRYSPPEVLLAMDRHDIATKELVPYPDKVDIWALGAILFEIVTGRPLIDKNGKKSITTTVLKGQLDSMRSQRRDVHSSLDKLLERMLLRKPQDRPDIDIIIKAIEERIFTVRPPRISV